MVTTLNLVKYESNRTISSLWNFNFKTNNLQQNVTYSLIYSLIFHINVFFPFVYILKFELSLKFLYQSHLRQKELLRTSLIVTLSSDIHFMIKNGQVTRIEKHTKI